MLSFFPPDVFDEILDLIESVSEGFPTYSCVHSRGHSFDPKFIKLCHMLGQNKVTVPEFRKMMLTLQPVQL